MGQRSSAISIAEPAAGPDASATATAPRRRLEFNRMLVHWAPPHGEIGSYVDSGYLAFVDEVQPQLVGVGFYGCIFWSFAHVPEAVRGPIQGTLPGDGNQKACGQWFENLNKELHKRGIKVVGHFDVELHVTGLIDGPQGPREGFFKFYNELWDEKELGPKPVKDPLVLVQRNADGSPMLVKRPKGYSPWPLYSACMINPYWQTVLKAFVKRGIERGVDGFVANYFYREGCMCPWCVRGFKDFLRQRYRPAELRKNFGIEDLEKHEFAEIVGRLQPGKMTPLRWEQLRFTCISMKNAYDKVFIAHGRSLKPDLILAAWLHGHFTPAPDDERLMLPPELWAKGEDYIWYS
jgi:hypothetical protein